MSILHSDSDLLADYGDYAEDIWSDDDYDQDEWEEFWDDESDAEDWWASMEEEAHGERFLAFWD